MKLKFNRDFYNPLTRKTIKKGSSIQIEADKNKIPLHQFWRGIIKDNSITDIVDIDDNSIINISDDIDITNKKKFKNK